MLSQAATEGVLLTQVRPPTHRVTLIKRPRLIEQLNFLAQGRVILIQAPAGYGKTTLLTQWSEHLSEVSRRVSWLTCDTNIMTAEVLVQHLFPELWTQSTLESPSRKKGAKRNRAAAALEAVINRLAEGKETVYVIIDKCECIAPEHLDAVLRPLLKWGPDSLKIVLAGRQIPNFEIEALRVRGQVAEIGLNALRFNRNDMAALLGGNVSIPELEGIERQTLGWPIALQSLKALWRHGSGPPTERAFGETGNLRNYILEQVLPKDNRELETFLVELSVLDRFCERSALAILGTARPWVAMCKSPELSSFLISDDRVESSYSFHPMLLGALRTAFGYLPLVRRDELNRNAAEWHRKEQNLVPAIRHALAANDEELANRYIEEAGALRIWLSHGLKSLKAIDELLRPAMLERHPRLQLLRAIMLTKQGKSADARRLFEHTRCITNNFGFDDSCIDEVNVLQYESLVVDSTLMFNQCLVGPAKLIARYAKVASGSTKGDPVLVASVKTAQLLMHYQMGEHVRSLELLSELAELRQLGAAPNAEFFDFLHYGAIHLAQGRTGEAERSLDKATGIVRRHFPEDHTKRTLLSVLRADLARETGLWRSNQRHLKDIDIRLAKAEAWFDIHASAAEGAMMVHASCGDWKKAHSVIERARAQIEERDLVGLQRFLNVLSAQCHALSGNLENSECLIQDLGILADKIQSLDSCSWRERELLLSTYARVAIARSKAAKVILPLRAAVAQCEQRDEQRSLSRLLPLLAHALYCNHEQDAAISTLAEALRVTQRTGFVYGIVSDPAIVAFVRQAVANRLLDQNLLDVAERSLQFEPSWTTGRPTTGIAALSVREREVLAQLTNGVSDKHIARRMDLSENTVKFHLKNIYRKLAAKSRNEAIIRAQSDQ